MKFSDLKFCCLKPIRSIVQIIVKLAPFCTVNSRCCFPYLDRFIIVDDCKKKNTKKVGIVCTFLNDKIKAKHS